MIDKGQSAIEFLIIVGVLMMIFVSLIFAVYQNLGDKNRERYEIELRDVAVSIQDEISLAGKTIDGYERVFEIPEKIRNKNYEVNIIEGDVYLITNDGSFAVLLPVGGVNGDVVKGQNIIKKIDGEIYLNT